ncbi:MAG TPA: DUF4388 domain-containing protein [Planctomycetota bacterium]|nr:DUF4388 domain-containing protein [Planctomycetota bacterium]
MDLKAALRGLHRMLGRWLALGPRRRRHAHRDLEERVRCLMARFRFPAARRLVERAAADLPQETRLALLRLCGNRLALGRELAGLGRWSEAARELQTFTPDHAGYAEAAELLGRCYAALGLTALAREKYEELLAWKPLSRFNVGLYLDYWNLLRALGDARKADEIKQRVLAVDIDCEAGLSEGAPADGAAGAEAPAGLTMEGTLDAVSLVDVFQMLSVGRRKGTLVLWDGESRKSIYFGDGCVRLLSSGRRKGLRVGEILVRRGRITRTQLEDIMRRHRDSARRLGDVLVGMGLITGEELADALRRQVEEEIWDLFLWHGASFRFIDGPPVHELLDPTNRALELALDVTPLLLEAVHRADEWAEISRSLPTVDCVLEPTGAGEAPSPPAPAGALLDGHRTVREIIEASDQPRLEVFRALMDALRSGRARLLPPRELAALARKEVAGGDPERAVRLFEGAAAMAPRDERVLAECAVGLEEEGRWPQAARLYDRLAELAESRGKAKRAAMFRRRGDALRRPVPEVEAEERIRNEDAPQPQTAA